MDRRLNVSSLNQTLHANETEEFLELMKVDLFFYITLYKFAVPTLFGLIMLAGLIGNSFVVCVTISQSRMHTTVNILLLNLAFSDLIFLVICVPFMAYHYAAENWLMGDVMCKLSQYLLYVTVYVTVYTLVSISVVRFVHIVYAQRSSKIRSWISYMIACIWFVMLVVNVPVLMFYRVKRFPTTIPSDEPYYYCGMENHQVHGPRLFLSFFILTYIVPLMVIATMYLLILRYLRIKRQRSSLNQRHREEGQASGAQRRTSYASRIFLVVVVVFGVCWLPLHIHLLVAYFGEQPTSRAYEVYRALCHCFAYSNSCMNPFIYSYVSRDFRQSLKIVLASGCRDRVRHPSILVNSAGPISNENVVMREFTSRQPSNSRT